jgi:hypothetical protein
MSMSLEHQLTIICPNLTAYSLFFLLGVAVATAQKGERPLPFSITTAPTQLNHKSSILSLQSIPADIRP